MAHPPREVRNLSMVGRILTEVPALAHGVEAGMASPEEAWGWRPLVLSMRAEVPMGPAHPARVA